ncbi:CLUMA_CG001881, isoform A [Clunio marinus]|uniref:CLUMA_CG001881, isoform A n=1 Tax=Clunio marinus TaxID=568069 RepID=A0A1J1HJ73_9DIPT|nr:CLUMA_CG001881, isoform A [Clunio marinus]
MALFWIPPMEPLSIFTVDDYLNRPILARDKRIQHQNRSVSRFDPEERERLQHQEQPDIYQIKAHFKLAPNV